MKAFLELRIRAPRSPAILACGGFAAFAILPWAVGVDVTAPRLGVSAALLGAALVLARSALGDLGQERQKLSSDRCRALVLTSAGAGALYRADVELTDGYSLPLSEHADPAEVLRDVSAAIEQRAVPLRSTWGLPEGATPWLGSALTKAAPRRPERLSAPIWHGQTQIGATVLGCATFIVIAIAVMLASRMERGAPTSALSLVLPALSVAGVYLIGAAIVSARVAISWDESRLVVEERALGLRLRERSISLAQVSDFYAVSPTGVRPTHLLIFTREGPFAVRCAQDTPERVVLALRPRDPGSAPVTQGPTQAH